MTRSVILQRSEGSEYRRGNPTMRCTFLPPHMLRRSPTPAIPSNATARTPRSSSPRSSAASASQRAPSRRSPPAVRSSPCTTRGTASAFRGCSCAAAATAQRGRHTTARGEDVRLLPPRVGPRLDRRARAAARLHRALRRRLRQRAVERPADGLRRRRRQALQPLHEVASTSSPTS